MAQPVYPTLSQLPEAEGYVRRPAYAPVKQTNMEDGALLIMATQTAVPLYFEVPYRDLPEADMNTLLSFWSGEANFGAIVIKYTDPLNATGYFVHFIEKPDFRLEARTGANKWHGLVKFLQAIGTYT